MSRRMKEGNRSVNGRVAMQSNDHPQAVAIERSTTNDGVDATDQRK